MIGPVYLARFTRVQMDQDSGGRAAARKFALRLDQIRGEEQAHGGTSPRSGYATHFWAKLAPLPRRPDRVIEGGTEVPLEAGGADPLDHF